MVGGILFQSAFMAGEKWNTGLLFGRPGAGLRQAANLTLKGNLPLILIGGALSAAAAPRGHAVSAASRTLGTTIGGLVGGALLGPAGIIAGTALGDKMIGRHIERGVQALHDFGGNMRRLEMGGDFRDTQESYTMRQVAVREMGSSLLNARRHLGQEAAFMHT